MALNGELSVHLGYEKYQPRKDKNVRNGYTPKTVICDESEMAIDTPRDCDGTFEPQLIKKNQTRITGVDEQIIALYTTIKKWLRCSKSFMMRMPHAALFHALHIRSKSVFRNGKIARLIRFIQLFIWIALW